MVSYNTDPDTGSAQTAPAPHTLLTLPLVFADVRFVPSSNPLEADSWGVQREDSAPGLAFHAFGFGDGVSQLLAQAALPTVLRVKHIWGRMPQGSAAAHEGGAEMATAVSNTSTWGEWQELAPALAHPVGWEVAGTLPDANPPVALFRPVPPAGFAALGVVAVPYSPDAHKGRLVRQPSAVMAVDATSRGAAVAARAAAARRGAAAAPAGRAALERSPSQRLGGSTERSVFGASGAKVAPQAPDGQRLPPPPALDSVWCVHFSMLEPDNRLLLTGIPTDGAVAEKGEDGIAAPTAPQLISLSTLGRSFDVRSRASLSRPASDGRNMGPLFRLNHQPEVRPISFFQPALQELIQSLVEQSATVFHVRHQHLKRINAPIPQYV